jgi:diguanylate cyclase (GGDEF)-like protein/PAS domain S-box-containing protein
MQSVSSVGAGRVEPLLLVLLLAFAYLSAGSNEQQLMLRDLARRTASPALPATALGAVEDQLFRRVFEQAAGMALLAPDGRWLRVNRSLCATLGYSENELLERSLVDLAHPDDGGATLGQIEKLLEGKIPSYQTEQRFTHKLGHYVWMLLDISPVRDSDGNPSYLVFQFQDITPRKVEEERLIHNVFHDALTGLPNRTLFMDRLRLATERARRRKDQVFAVLFLDLDGFKAINDSMGHIMGDQLLIQISRRLNAALRTTDTIARLGGDEFTILLEDLTDEREAVRVVERLQKELAQPFKLGASDIHVTASIGIASNNPAYERAEDILRDADTAMYRAKSSGKACYQLVDREGNTPPLDVTNLGDDLDKAVDRGELVLHYQPIVSLQTGKLFAFEALIRWQHPQRGLILPSDFIPLAEEKGSILEIGTWAIREACLQLKRWQDRFSLHSSLAVTVNLSSKQFRQPNLIDQVIDILQDTGVDPRALKLEITEGVVMENIGTATVLLQQLRALGIELGVDDFGTGYSSLSYLHRLPISLLKIDKSFVKGMVEKREHAEIVKTILTLARSLGIRVVAEGVETLEQLVELRRLRCDAGQGFLFSKPADAETAETLLAFKTQWQATIASLDVHGEFEAPSAASAVSTPPARRALLRAV